MHGDNVLFAEILQWQCFVVPYELLAAIVYVLQCNLIATLGYDQDSRRNVQLGCYWHFRGMCSWRQAYRLARRG